MNYVSHPRAAATVRLGAALALAAGSTWLAGCARPAAQPAKTDPAKVVFERPVVRDVTDYEDFTGHTEPYESVDMKANVPGYLSKIHVGEGLSVSQGTVLFTIDPRTYQADVSAKTAAVEKSKADLKLAEASFARGQDAFKKGVIGQEAYDQAEASRDAALANRDAAEAAQQLARTNLEYTTIKARFTGRLGPKVVSEGSMVKERETLLNTLVVLDPIYVAFDIDERTLLKFRRLIAEHKITSNRENQVVVQVGLADEEGHSLSASMTFASNVLDPNTGTLRIKAELHNPDLQIEAIESLVGTAAAIDTKQKGLKLLSPYMFVRIRLPVGAPHPAILIPEEALGSDQGERYVYLLNDKDEVVSRRVKIGSQQGRLRVIDAGVAPTDRVIVSGHQRVRPGVKVSPLAAEEFRQKSSAAKGPAAEKK